MNNARGVVILYEDLCDSWIEWAKQAKLTTLGVHKITSPDTATSLNTLLSDLEKPNGRRHIEMLEDAGITVEYELHTLSWLLPRDLFAHNPSLFRMNENGERTNDLGFCPSNEEASDIITENSYRLAKMLHQNSSRYFLWSDDVPKSVCHCPKCAERKVNGSDAAMIFTNAVAKGLTAYDSAATESYLAYSDANDIPTIAPDHNVFLEFAPMTREHKKPISDPTEERSVAYLKLLEGLLKIFSAKDAHILEYWMDNALYSNFKRPPVKVPFLTDIAEQDIQTYTSYGIPNVKTFASFIGDEYISLHGTPPIKEYGDILAKYIK